jgi:hypothetical protein
VANDTNVGFTTAGGRTPSTGNGLTSTAYVQADGRTLTHTKQTASSLIKITLADTIRASYFTNGGYAYFAVMVDGAALPKPCEGMSYDSIGATATGNDFHHPMVMTCIAESLAAGPHTYTVWLKAAGPGQVMLGWDRSYPLLMVEEVEPGGGIDYHLGTKTTELSGSLNAWAVAPDRYVIHDVSSTSKAIKITYSDTMRAGYISGNTAADGNGGYVDVFYDDGSVEKSVPGDCMAAAYHYNGLTATQDHHFPLNMVCIVRGVSPGPHTFTLRFQNHTGGSIVLGGGRGQSLMMVEDMP